jgi:endo-1,4-beta-xylanase
MVTVRRLVLVALVFAALPVAPAAAWRTIEAESFTPDPSAHGAITNGRYALGMRGGTARTVVSLRGATRIAIRVRSEACHGAAIVRVLVDGRAVLRRPVMPRHWRHYEAPVKLANGEHDVAVQLYNPDQFKGCRRTLRVDSIAFKERIPITTAVSWEQLSNDAAYRNTFLANFDGMTPENEMKWQFLEPIRNQYNWAPADGLVDFAQAHHLEFHGHALVFAQQLPRWLSPQSFYPKPELEGILRGFISTVMSRYWGRVESWDVINEPLANNGSLAMNNVFAKLMGQRYIDVALQTAHATDPNAKLFINEIGADGLNAKSDGLYRLVSSLKARGIPIDGVGFQFHTSLDPAAVPKPDNIAANFKRFADLGLEIAVSEMAVRTSPGTGSLADRFAAQADVYRTVAAACAEQPACVRFTTWGFSDSTSWLGIGEHALPFYDTFQPKPAWRAITDELR